MRLTGTTQCLLKLFHDTQKQARREGRTTFIHTPLYRSDHVAYLLYSGFLFFLTEPTDASGNNKGAI